jgi:ubiquitin C-terminal hydrolase
VAIGFMKLIGTLLTPEYQPTGFVVFLFSECLFPQSSDKSHELKSARSRKEAYDLVYRLCSFERRELDELFKANFKKIYKTVSQVKMSNYFKEVRSEYGYAGIHNLGCICYMISMLQQFFLTKPFRYLMLMADDGIADKYRKYGNR